MDAQRRAVGTARAAASGAQLHPVLRGLVGWPTLRDSCVDEPSPLIRPSRAGVVAANHQVGRPVLPSGPIHDRADELAGNTRASSCRSHPHRNQLNPSLSDRLSADDTDILRRFLRQESQRNLSQAGLPALGWGIDPVGIARTEGCWRLGQRRQPHRPKPLPVGRSDPRDVHPAETSKRAGWSTVRISAAECDRPICGYLESGRRTGVWPASVRVPAEKSQGS